MSGKRISLATPHMSDEGYELNYIKEAFPNVEVDVYLEELPERLKVLKNTDKIIHEIVEPKVYDLFVVLDCGDAARLGFSHTLYENAYHTLCVDHHISNDSFAQENYVVPEASSTSELVYRLIDKDKITKEVAECLFLGIVHDTGVFQYSCTSPETMEAAADLMRRDICPNEIIDKTFYEKTYAQNQILARAVLDSILLMDGKCIATWVTKDTMAYYCVTQKDLDGIVSQLRITKGVEVAIFMYELEAGKYKVSLRATNDVDVNKIAQTFGGGGHKKAAGITMNGMPRDIVNQITKEVEAQL